MRPSVDLPRSRSSDELDADVAALGPTRSLRPPEEDMRDAGLDRLREASAEADDATEGELIGVRAHQPAMARGHIDELREVIEDLRAVFVGGEPDDSCSGVGATEHGAIEAVEPPIRKAVDEHTREHGWPTIG